MMHTRTATALAERVEPLLPEDHEATAAPWSDHPKSEWIVTVWRDGVVLFDVFEVGQGQYVARKVGRGAEVGRPTDAESIAALVTDDDRVHSRRHTPLDSTGRPRERR